MTLLLAHGDGDLFGDFSSWTFVLRFGEQVLHLVPYLLFGVLLAGLLRTNAGYQWLRGALDGPWSHSLPRAILLGLITPVGAVGGLPIASEMLRAGLRPSVVLGFLVTAPLFMPWSFGYAADALGLLNASLIVLGGALLAAIIGAVARPFEAARPPRPQPVATPKRSQLLAALRAAADHASGWLLMYALLAVTASAAFAAVLQPGSIEAHIGDSSVVALLELAAPIALANPEPDVAVLYASEFWRIGLLPGGMFVALYLGAGWSFATLAWCIHRIRAPGLLVIVTWLAVAVGIASIANTLPQPNHPGEADSHSFDMLTKPYNFGGGSTADGVAEHLRRAADGNELALAAFTLLFGLGVLNRWRARPGRAATPDTNPPNAVAHAGPPRVTIRMTLLGAVATCLVVSVFTYFPSPSELHDRLRLQSGNLFEAVSVLNTPRHTPDQHAAARSRARHALARLDGALAKYPVSRAVHLWTPHRAPMDAAALRTKAAQVDQLIAAGPSDQLELAAVEFLRRLTQADA